MNVKPTPIFYHTMRAIYDLNRFSRKFGKSELENKTMYHRLISYILYILPIILLVLTVQGQTVTPSDLEITEPKVDKDITPLPVIHNDEWIPTIKEFNGVEMVLVPPGCFMMGTTNDQMQEVFEMCEVDNCRKSGFENALPSHRVCFDNHFWIDRYEVTNTQISRFDEILFSKESNWDDAEKPHINISWLDARQFCNLRKARLPTEAEWEYAARGPDNFLYPWSNEFVSDYVVHIYSANRAIASVGNKTKNVSWVGAFDMSGNVWEWVNTIYDPTLFPYPYNAEDGRESNDAETVLGSQRVLRGGSWQTDVSMLTTWYRLANNVLDSSVDWGFRCAYSEK